MSWYAISILIIWCEFQAYGESGYDEDVRIHQPHCHNASAFALRGYVDTLSPLIAMHHHDLACAYENFEITMFPNTTVITKKYPDYCHFGVVGS